MVHSKEQFDLIRAFEYNPFSNFLLRGWGGTLSKNSYKPSFDLLEHCKGVPYRFSCYFYIRSSGNAPFGLQPKADL